MKMTPIACAISILFATPLLAQEANTETPNNDEFENIIVTGSSVARTEADTPAKTTLIGKDQIANTGFSSQADILMSVPGK